MQSDDPPLTPGRGNRRGGMERAVVAPSMVTRETRRGTMMTATKITLAIDSDIQGDERDQLWQVCCSSHPVIAMSEDSDSDFDRWVVERVPGTNDEQYLNERETLRDCIYNLGYVIEGYGSDEWQIR